ncbi:MAG: phenylalanine--tRNA ligase subunit beta, partial [Candidatus Cloacimonadaceae bacterium]|nr:phenylalanine--tRNA ligase subunit beta [Candidatus Cloacimonadaceae bacterium]
MLETGHPLHAFDYNSLAGTADRKQIIIRSASPQEKIKALDGKEYILDPADLVIADAEKPIAIAGIIGGANSHITEATTDIVLESAAFDPGSVRRTSYKHKINTDSSYRFERHLSEYAPDYASRRATQLILETAGGLLCRGVLDDWQNPSPPRILGIRPCRFAKIIGYEMSGEQITEYLSKLGLTFIQYGSWIPGLITDESELYCFHGEQIKQGVTEFDHIECVHTLYFRIPDRRLDLEREIDLIEELARLDGYDKIPQKTAIPIIMDRHAHQIKRKLQDLMTGSGLYEVINYSFDDPQNLIDIGYEGETAMANPLKLINPQSSNLSIMRTTLVPQALKSLAYNLNHGERNARIFEMNKVYLRQQDGSHTEPVRLCAILTGAASEEHWSTKDRQLDFFDLKGIAERVIELMGRVNVSWTEVQRPYLVPAYAQGCVTEIGEIVLIGKLKPETAARFGIDVIDLKQDVWVVEVDVENMIETSRTLEIVYEPIPKFPGMARDISFLIGSEVSFTEIKHAILGVETRIINSVSVFDEYRGKQVPEGFRSLSLHLIFNDSEKTLTVERIDELVDSVIKMLQNTWQIKMR